MGLFALKISKGTTPDGAPYLSGADVAIEFYDDYLVWDKGIVSREIARIYYSDIISVAYSNGNFAAGAFITISTAGKNYTSKTSAEYSDLHEMANAIETMRHKAKTRTYAHIESNTLQKQTEYADAMATVFPETTGAGYYLYKQWIDEKSMISILESIDNRKLFDAATKIRKLANIGLADAMYLVENFDKIDFKVPQSKNELIEKFEPEIKTNDSVTDSHIIANPQTVDALDEEDTKPKSTDNQDNLHVTSLSDKQEPPLN